MTSLIVRSIPLAVLLALSGCGVELTGGGQRGETEVVMTDSPDPGGGSASRAAASRSLAPGGTDAAAAGPSMNLSPGSQVAVATGSLDVTGSVALLPAEGNPVQLTTGNSRVELGLAASDSVRLALRSLDAATYAGVRLTFTAIEATLQTPILTTSGTLLEGEISVDLSGGPLVVDVPLSVAIEDDERTTLVVDLNASLWLVYADPVSRRVAPDVVRAAVTVEVE